MTATVPPRFRASIVKIPDADTEKDDGDDGADESVESTGGDA